MLGKKFAFFSDFIVLD